MPLGTTELLIILAIVILIFGVNKIPKLGKGLGEGIRNFKSSLKADAPAGAGADESREK